jgi:hypothetical protein
MDQSVDDICDELLVCASFARLGSDELLVATSPMDKKVAFSPDRFQQHAKIEIEMFVR